MSEKQLKNSNFAYSSNLVIQREHGHKTDEPTGEPESLVGRINPRDMGNLARREKPQRPKKDQHLHLKKGVDIEIEPFATSTDNLLYRPKTKENRVLYEKLLSIVYNILQEQSQDVIKSVVDEILAIMKSESKDARQEVEALIGKVTNELFSDIVINTKGITDYNLLEGARQDEIEVPLNLEEEAESSDPDEIHDESEESANEQDLAIKTKVSRGDLQATQLFSVDGYWLQRELNKIYNDPIQSQQMESSVLHILNAPTDIECENQLVSLLSHERFDIIQTLHQHRHEIYYGTLLGKAQSQDQIDQIHQQMRATPEGLELLTQLQGGKRESLKQKEMEVEIEFPILKDNEISALNMKQIDLEQLQFVSQGHFMSNEKCHLPPHSFKVSGKGYEAISIPAPKPYQHTEPLVSINDLPAYARDAFKGFKELNVIQSAVYEKALLGSENMLICAPTGAGKTNIALLTMLQIIGQYTQNGVLDLTKFKIIYIAPMKALVNEMVHNFQTRLEPYNIKVAEVTGDTHLTKSKLKSTQVLIATPEKWDILSRKIQQNEFLQLVRLLIVDEIHLLHDSRGPVLESLIARTIRQSEERQEEIRIVGLSATLPNYADVATFIRAKKSGVFFFDNSFRPVPLLQQYIGITEKKPIRRMLLMNELLYEKVSERGGKAQILIFVHSRKETVKTALTLKEMAFAKDELGKFIKDESHSKKILDEVVSKEEIRSNDLKELLKYGFAIHHAGLARGDRDMVESLFEKKHIQVLVSTSTLAWGVNLPAHTVIIKGTQIYSPEQGRWVELSPQDILQMMGRAGRPRYDTEGEGIIITTYQELKYYLSLLNMQLPIESQMISCLADSLNAEIASGTVKSIKDAINWIGYTYLYVRMMRQPTLYGCTDPSDQHLVKYRADLVHTCALVLEKNVLIKYDRRTGSLESTFLGRIASDFYIKYPNMAIYNQHLKPNMGMIDILKVFSLSQEFKLIPIREEEKGELQKLMMSVPVPIKGSAEDPTTKVNVLLQSYISRLRLEGYAINSDLVYVTQSAGRIMRALFEICLKKEWAQSALQCLALSKMVEKRMWNCMTPLRQFKGLPDDMLRRIEKKEGITWEHLYNMSAQQLGELIRYQNQPLTKTIHKYIHKFPKIEIQAFAQPITRSCLKIDLQLGCDFQWDEKIHGKAEPFHIFVLDCDGEKILYHEQLLMKQKNQPMQFTLTVPLFEIMHPIYFIRVISDKWLCCESEQPVPFKNLILPEPFLRCTELLQLTPLSIDILKQPQLENIISKRILFSKQFDQMQTQVFQQVYNSNDNFFMGSPSFTTKHIIPHLAIMQLQRGHKAVYVSPLQVNCEQKFQDFMNLFAKPLSFKVAMLTGQIANDSKLLEQSDIIVSTAVNWDIMSRRWRARKGFKDIKIFIVDDLHMIADAGSVLEVIVSRMRMIQAENQFRIVALSLSVADYKEFAEWIGARHVFNFLPTVRPNNVQIIISSFDQCQRSLRIQAMLRAVKQQLSNDELNIVYVSDRKLARITALELMNYNEQSVPQMVDQYIQHTMSGGVGYLYECIDPKDETEIFNFLEAKKLKTIVMTHKLALHYKLSGQVFVLDNQKYDGLEKRFVDYTITEMLELLEYASKQCHILTYAPKKEYYKKFLFEPMPIESHLNHYLSNHLNAEIVAKNIHNTQDCIDWITWTFLYRRLTCNPNYYNLHEVTGMAINNYLSELIEQTIEELHEAKCIAVEEDNELEAINSGIISNYYYINVDTVRNFQDKINAGSKLRDLLMILSESQEFEVLNIRNGEEVILQQLAHKVPYTPTSAKLNEPNTKALILFQSHFSRLKLNPDLKSDLSILELGIRLVNAMVDVSSSNLWLQPALCCMHLCQMIVQAMWKEEDSELLQFPHFTQETISQLKLLNVADIADFVSMDEAVREKFLSQFTQQQVDEIALAANRYPSVEIKEVCCEKEVTQGEVFRVQVVLERQDDVYSDYVIAPRYPKPKEESWWILCAEKRSKRLFGNKRVSFQNSTKVDLRFQAPEKGDYEMTIYAICDSYIGAERMENFKLRVTSIIEQEQD